MDPEAEAAIRAHFDAGRFEEAATEAMRRYGRNVYGFLVNRMNSRDRADEAFSQLGEDLWKGIESFRWGSAFSTWMYTLARHAAARYERAPQHQARRHTTAARLDDEMERVRTGTKPYLKTEVKDRFAALRATLSADERTLLSLRVDQSMSWQDIARIMSDEALEEAAVSKAAAACRQRFATLKKKLRELAEREGLLGGQ